MTPTLQAPPRPPTERRTNGRIPPAPPDFGGDGDGEHEPGPRRGLDNLRLAVLFFMGAEAMFFGALISALFVLRLGMAAWPPPLEPRLPVAVTGLNTLVLLASSVTLTTASRARRRRDHARHVRWLRITAVLGALFLVVQGYEWIRLIGYGLTLASGVYGTTFFALIGFHGLHVLAALAWLLATTALVARGRFAEGRIAPLQACAMFWHFVVGVWPVLYVTVYLV
jgi:heme/copper-type cytochrome/quinol oxidase subunit 3